MSKNECLKRKTVKLKQPNPLFEKWLEEWRDEAAARKSDTQYAFTKALHSIKKYPLPLKTGKECLILENFGTRICLLLDRKLTDYRKTHPEEQDLEHCQQSIDEIQPPKSKKSRKTSKISRSPTKERDKTYTPSLRSAPYAIIVALFENLQKNGSPGELTKSELQKVAQPLCDTSMFKPLPGSYYSGWSCVGQLVTKQLVLRSGNPHKYCLTEEGIRLGEKLTTVNLDSDIIAPTSLKSTNTNEVSKFSPHKQNLDEALDNNGKRKATTKQLKKKNEPSLQTQVIVPSIDIDEVPDKNCMSQESTSTQSSQTEEIIFLPGSFETYLLVDTQEIHRGDELVKALEALKVKLEVRRLKVGDFAWVSRSAAGHELILPYIVERKRLDDLAKSIKDGRFHEQKFRMKQCGVSKCMYLVESHGQRQYSLPVTTLLQAAANTEFVDRFSVKYTANSHETVLYLAMFTKVITRKFTNKTLIGCMKSLLPKFDIQDDCVSLMTFKEFNKLSNKTRKYSVREMFIKHLVQLRGLSVEKALAIVERYPCPRSLISAFQEESNDRLLADVPAGNLNRKIGPVISKALYDLYNK